MKSVALETQNPTLKELVVLAQREPVYITQGGKTRYAFVVVDESDLEAYRLGSNPAFVAYLEACRKRARRGGTVSLAEMRRRLGLSG